jgi:uncharacterized RDD family membrane protein YckC
MEGSKMNNAFKIASKGKRIKAFSHDVLVFFVLFLAINTSCSIIRSEGKSLILWDSYLVLSIIPLLILFEIYTALAIYYYGQTLGAKKYGIKVMNEDGGKVSFFQSWKRAGAMLSGLTFLFQAFMTNKEYQALKGRYTWDRFSKTMVVECA